MGNRIICGIVVAAMAAGALGGLSRSAGSQAPDKPRIAVLELITRDAKDEAEAVAEEIRNAFVKSGRYQVVDRTLTAKIFDEWAMQQSGATEQDRAQRIGKLYTVRNIVTGKLNRFAG